MSDFRIEKGRAAVVLTMAGAGTIQGEMFVQANSRHRAGPEHPEDILNDEEPFFPMVLDSGETLLIAKDQVLQAEMEDSTIQSLIENGAVRPAAVELTLAGGNAYSGTLFLEVRADRPRLLDFLNKFEHRFFLLHSSNGVRLINRHFIEHVRPLD